MAVSEFSGNFSHTLDPKGRVTIPAAFREALGETFRIGLNNQFEAVALYPAAKWDKIGSDLAKIPDSDIRGMKYVRLIKGNSFEAQLDGQGRVLLPAALRAKAGLAKEIRLVGVGEFLEIWDEARYQQMNAADEDNVEALLEYVNRQYYAPHE